MKMTTSSRSRASAALLVGSWFCCFLLLPRAHRVEGLSFRVASQQSQRQGRRIRSSPPPHSNSSGWPLSGSIHRSGSVLLSPTEISRNADAFVLHAEADSTMATAAAAAARAKTRSKQLAKTRKDAKPPGRRKAKSTTTVHRVHNDATNLVQDDAADHIAIPKRPHTHSPPRSKQFRKHGHRQRSQNNGSDSHNDNKHKHKGANRKEVQRQSYLAVKLNSRITSRPDALDILELLASVKGSLTSYGGGGTLNSINYSTCLHRIAKHVAYAYVNRDARSERSRILSDPRFGLFMCSLSEAFLSDPPVLDTSGKDIVFRAREMSNTAWAIAKLKIAPPVTALPMEDPKDREENLRKLASTVRSQIYAIAKSRASASGNPDEDGSKPWIPELSQLCGSIIDVITARVQDKGASLSFRSQEWANLVWAMSTINRVDKDFFEFVIDHLIIDSKATERVDMPQEWSNTIWALATAAINGPEDVLYPYVAHLMDSSEQFVKMFKPQELSNTGWGVATTLAIRQSITELDEKTVSAALTIMRHVAKEAIARDAENFKSQEVSNTLWAFATLGFGLSSGNENIDDQSDYIILPSDDPQGDAELVRTATETFIRRAKAILGRFKSQELNNLAWALARLQYNDTQLLRSISMQMVDTQRKVRPQDIGTTLWAFAKLEYFDYNAYRGCATRLQKIPGRMFKSQELSNTCWAIATAEAFPVIKDAFETTLLMERQRPTWREMQEDPIIMMMAKAATEIMQRPDGFKAQEIKDVLWSFSKVDVRHPALFKSVAKYMVENPHRMHEFSPQGVGNMAWSFARQAQLSDVVLQRHGSKVRMPHTSGRLAVYTTSFVDVGEALLQKLFNGLASVHLTTYNKLSQLSAQDISNTAWAFAVLGMKHPEFLDSALEQTVQRLQATIENTDSSNRPVQYMKGQEISNLLWAASLFNQKVPEGLLEQIATSVSTYVRDEETGKVTAENVFRHFKAQELANIAWACAVQGEYPPTLIEMIYVGLMGVGENPDPEYLKKIHQSEGIQTSAVISILYLQIVMDLEGKAVPGLELPPNFPEGWEAPYDEMSRLSQNLLENGLDLNPSGLQRSVEDGLARVGFHGVQEYCITMEHLASEEVGCRIAPFKKELLSIDIADPERKIGIEVDGPAHWVTRIDLGIPSKGGYTVTPHNKIDYHFGWGESQEVNGSSSLKVRLLESLGWKILSVPFWDWYALQSLDEQDEYCRQLLKDAL